MGAFEDRIDCSSVDERPSSTCDHGQEVTGDLPEVTRQQIIEDMLQSVST
jgi:hypothetical protein